MRAIILALLLFSLTIFPVTSQSTLYKPVLSGLNDNKQGICLLSPIAEATSGRVWLYLNNLDPIHAESQYRGYTLQVPGAGPVRIPFREPSPKFSRNVIVSHSVGRYPYQTEPCVAINPTNPDNLVLALDDYSFHGDAIYVSVDGGVTWEGPVAMKVLMRDEWGGNPTLTFDREGNVYFSQMSIGYRWIRVADLALSAEIASIAFYKSMDGGLTWSDPVIAAQGMVFVPPLQETLVLTFLDRPWMTVGPNPSDLSRDNIYITYTEFALHYPLLREYPYIGAPYVEITIKLVRSIDGGSTFSEPVAVTPTYAYYAGEEYRRIVQGSQSAVAPDGTLYVAYYDALDDGPWRGLFAPTVARSRDGGLTFSSPVAIDYKHELDYWVPPTLFRAWPSMSPRIAVGPEGNVYVVFAANPLGSEEPDDSDIYFSMSMDGGESWSKPIRVNDDLTKRDQFFPSIGVGKNGTIHVAFGDRRDDPVDVRYHIYYTRSNDCGETWMQNVRVSDYPSNPNFGIPFFLGDFFSIAVSDEDTYVAWTDTRLGRLGSPTSNAALARMRPIPSPSIFLSPPSGPAGTSVTVMGFNFRPNLCEVYIEFEGVIIASVLTNEEGRFTANLFIPVSGEGPHTIRAMDSSGNVAEATFYADVGFDALKDIMERLTSPKTQEQPQNITESIEHLNRTLTDKMEKILLKFDAQASNVVVTMYVVVTLAVASTSLSILSVLIVLRRRRGV